MLLSVMLLVRAFREVVAFELRSMSRHAGVWRDIARAYQCSDTFVLTSGDVLDGVVTEFVFAVLFEVVLELEQ